MHSVKLSVDMTLNQIKSHQITSNQIKPNQTRPNQIKSTVPHIERNSGTKKKPPIEVITYRHDIEMIPILTVALISYHIWKYAVK